MTSAVAVAEVADPVCVVLPSLTAVEEIVLGARGLAADTRGRTVVQMSTISPALTERLARECATRGVAFLDSATRKSYEAKVFSGAVPVYPIIFAAACGSGKAAWHSGIEPGELDSAGTEWEIS